MFYLYVIRGDNSGAFSGPFSTHATADAAAAAILSRTETAFSIQVFDQAQFLKLARPGEKPHKPGGIGFSAYGLANRLELVL